jgi:hypothetical protein
MTVYFRKVREDFLADTSLSLEAFRIMSYLVAQAPGFTFQLDHLALVFQGKIGRKRIERARAELIMGGYLVPGKRYRVGGQVRQDGALVNWDRACLPRSHRHPQNRRVVTGVT